MKQQNKIVSLAIIAFFLALLNLVFVIKSFSQDSVKAKITDVDGKTVIYKINGRRYVSFDCKCDSLKPGMFFMIPRKRFDSLLKEAKPIRKQDL